MPPSYHSIHIELVWLDLVQVRIQQILSFTALGLYVCALHIRQNFQEIFLSILSVCIYLLCQKSEKSKKIQKIQNKNKFPKTSTELRYRLVYLRFDHFKLRFSHFLELHYYIQSYTFVIFSYAFIDYTCTFFISKHTLLNTMLLSF